MGQVVPEGYSFKNWSLFSSSKFEHSVLYIYEFYGTKLRFLVLVLASGTWGCFSWNHTSILRSPYFGRFWDPVNLKIMYSKLTNFRRKNIFHNGGPQKTCMVPNETYPGAKGHNRCGKKSSFSL